MTQTDERDDLGGWRADPEALVVMAMSAAGHACTREQATLIIAEITAGRDDLNHPLQFVLAAIRRDPARYAPAPPPKGKKREHADHCGECHPLTRLVYPHPDEEDQRPRRCPACHALRGETLPQWRRCQGCGSLIARHAPPLDPCDRHLPVGVQMIPVQVPKREPRPPGDDRWYGGLHGEELARAQVAEARAGRLPEETFTRAIGPPGPDEHEDPADPEAEPGAQPRDGEPDWTDPNTEVPF